MHSCTYHDLPMMSRLATFVNFVSALGAGLVAGVFFAFSSFVMPALSRLPRLQGLVAMQSINLVVLNRSFLGVFLGTAAGSAWLVLDALFRWSVPGARLRLLGGALYLLGSLLVTGACNVPWNEMLAQLVPESARAARAWSDYVSAWSFWNHVRTAASLGAAALLVLGLGGCSRYWECDPPDAGKQRQLPEKLSQTGLFSGGRAADGDERLAAGVRQFEPRFELWSDGAKKRRFISLPEGERIDTSDPDNWVFPVGTQLWKEFTVDGRRVETRLLRKLGSGSEDWATQAYVWQADGADALATPGGADNVLGTAHDVPAAGACWACHGGRKSFVLGFSALQLGYTAQLGMLDLEDLQRERLVTQPPAATQISLPGDTTAQAALGYVHANCGHCHNQDRPAAAGSRCYDPDNGLDFWLRTGQLGSVAETPTFRSGRGEAFEPGAPGDSRMVELMSQRGFLKQMPPLGTELVDDRNLAHVRAWIAGLH
jgi:uncharacterized membrane protein